MKYFAIEDNKKFGLTSGKEYKLIFAFIYRSQEYVRYKNDQGKIVCVKKSRFQGTEDFD